MRKFLLSLTVLAGMVAISGAADAAPLAGPAPTLEQPSLVQNVAYYRGFHGRGYYHRHPVFFRRHYYRHGYYRHY